MNPIKFIDDLRDDIGNIKCADCDSNLKFKSLDYLSDRTANVTAHCDKCRDDATVIINM